MPKNPLSFLYEMFGESEEHKKRIIRTIKAKADARRTPTEKIADFMTTKFGSMGFLIVNALFFLFWLLVNTNNIPGIPAFDPFPFSLLTTIVSLEAIILAIFVLISQNRNMKVDDLREEIHLQINLIAEKEITKVMQMVTLLLEKQGIDITQDPELRRLLKPISADELERKLEKEIL
jgi:uncharacterized membrane protein